MRMWFLSAGLALMCMAQNAAAGTVLIVGDSISAGFGLDTRKGWVALLEQRLKNEGFDDTVVNASISGDTSAGGLARLPAALAAHKPEVVIIELGGNDGLRGQPPAQLQQNLASMIQQSRDSGAKVLLLGMQIPPNYGKRYVEAFNKVFGDVAQEKKVPLVPFFLEGVGGHPELMQADGLHPAVGAQDKLLENVWPSLKPLL
ncbi:MULTISPECIES: arylesterase [Pseudomonas]|uniref:Acyl-CoA thioesterase-1 n=1 Tax=Pseudomonas rhodesiae TaxID=76760 RepID=A0A5C5NP53_9PSED|nr:MULTISPECIES: arylesterase [Pseudomonas]OXS20347.1 arylesterase [Pseudomonas fluorescens]KAF6690540.1 arylesterase [Pseudomonas sp. EKM23D]MBB4815101.1 acyl-CoA thioesterase-1 [Pseudomonas rhodesiae]MBI6603484.1 arylesterase [Pseudomonas sp. S4_EA_1b]MBI6627263.1 arylesterase [Pseudomonas rhodesiae]